jgi:two-component system sensor histidine kinase SenX3
VVDVIRRGSAVRARLDGLRARFDRGPIVPSVSASDATDRLVLAVDRYLAREAASRLTADRLVSALDVVPQGIVLADGNGEIVFRNRAASGFFAARHSEALVESAIAELVALAVAGEATTRTLDLYGPPRRSLQLRSVPLGPAGDGGSSDPSSSSGAFLVVDDVSERQRLEAVRRDFVANISHELKTPVGALGVLAEALAGEDDPAVVQRLAERIQTEAFRVAHTIDDLLQLSQIEARETPDHEPVAARLVVAEAVDRTESAAALRGVKLVVDDAAGADTVVGDRRQLVSAVANLLDNAVKYSDDGAEVAVSIRRAGPSVEIVVADDGIGIPARDLERVFERFYRVDQARSRDTGGTGLGLAIVRHVAQNHQGEVTVTSREGEGSTFTLRLPAAGPAPHAAPGDPAPVRPR